MVTQKPLSLKLNYDLLEELDTEVYCSYHKRNWHINKAVRLYLSLQDARRLYKCVGVQANKEKILNDFLREWFPEAATW